MPVPCSQFPDPGIVLDPRSSIPDPGIVLDPRSSSLDPVPSTGNRQLATSNRSSYALTPDPLSPTPCSYITYLAHTLDLTKGEVGLHDGLRDSTRRNVRKAEKEKVEFRIEKTREAMRDFYRLNCMTRREHGLPPQPYHFFEKVGHHIISGGSGFVALAYYQGKAIAANVYFHFGDRAIYKYGASDKKYQDLRANNLVMWEAIKWFAAEGFKSFCFGRTELENEGLRQFKTGWGAEEQQIQYFKYDLRQGGFVPGKKKGEPAYTNLFRKTPIPVLNVIGSLFYKHMG